MKATCWMGPQKMQVREVPDPQILNKRDAIVKVTSTAICGSDLHLYNGFLPMMEPATSWATSSWARSSRSAAACRT
jgi:threonine dehydrogenase-like Zn-dependent dehydrogenase